MYIEAQTINQSIFFNFKSSLLYIWCIYVIIFWKSKSSHKFEKLLFLCHVITCKCMPLYKKTGLGHKKRTTLPCNHPINQACMNTNTLVHFLMDLWIAHSTIVKVLTTLLDLLSSFSFCIHFLISFACYLCHYFGSHNV
jgi:hypothetical protein